MKAMTMPVARGWGIADGIASAFGMSEGGGGVFMDSGRGRACAALGGPLTARPATIGGIATSFVGASNQRIEARVNNIDMIGGSPAWTVIAGIRYTTATRAGGYTIYAERNTTGNDLAKLTVGDTGGSGVQLAYRNDAGSLLQVFGATALNDGVFHVVGVTLRADASASVYLDGKQDGTGAFGGGAVRSFTDSTNVAWIGGDPADTPSAFTGDIAFLYTWRRALSQAEHASFLVDPYPFWPTPLGARL